MRLARGGVVTVAAVALAGCGDGSSHANQRRAAVNAYFDRADRAQAGLLSSAGEIDRAFRNFKLTGNSASELHGLAFARGRVGTALRRVRALAPPPEARHLHSDLVRLLTLQYAAADELLHIVTYEPQFERALAPLSPAGSALAHDIRNAAQTKPAPPSSPSDKTGVAVFAGAGCGSCHTLTAVDATGTSGPNLDVLRLSPAEVAARVRTGGTGMPAFASRLTPARITALASFVATAESRQASSAAVLDAYASAFTRYHDSLQLVLEGLDRLSAPPVLRSTLLAERQTLGRAATLSGAVAGALHRQDVKAANSAIRQLFNVAAAAGQASTRRKNADAVRAYNGRLKQIATLAAKIVRARQRLVQQVG